MILCISFVESQERLDQGWYCSEFEFVNDLRLVFTNCLCYNEEHSDLWVLATVRGTGIHTNQAGRQ